MYIPYQFLVVIENDRLRTAARRQPRVPKARKPRPGLGGRVSRAFGRRPAVEAIA